MIITNIIKTEEIQIIFKIIPYLSNLINDHKAIRNESNEWKIQISMCLNFIISSRDTRETCSIYVRSDNEEIRESN